MQRWLAVGLWAGLVAMMAGAAPEPTSGSGHWQAGVMLGRTGVDGAPPVLLPLKRTDVQLRLIAGIVSATVTQVFSNDTAVALEAIYLFPLPSRAAVTDMELRVGDRRIRSVVQEKAEARATYETARAAGKATALMESERPNLFRSSLANFMPGEEVSVTFTYTETADVVGGIYNVTFPMVVGERYFPATSALTAAEPATPVAALPLNPPMLAPEHDPLHRVALTLEIYGVPVERITSSTHALVTQSIRGRPGAWRVSPAAGLVLANNTFSVEVEPPLGEDPVPTWVTSTQEQSTYGLLTLFPPLAPTAALSVARDVVFLIDTSGSMSGDAMRQACQGLDACLAMLRPEDRFTIVRFASSFSAFRPAPEAAVADTVAAARAFVAGLQADGGTEMQPALRHSLAMLNDGTRLPLVVFMTDGAVGNEAELMRLLATDLGRARLFTFGIGSAPNEYLMRKMAELGRGQSRFIRADEDIGLVMADFFRTLASPKLTDVTVSWLDAFELPLTPVGAYPSRCPDVFIDRPLQVVAAFGDTLPAAVVISGTQAGEARAFRYALGGEGFAHTLVGRLFGQAQIDDWMTTLTVNPGGDAGLKLKARIVAAALEHQLVTPYTSRVAVEEQLVRAPDGVLHTVAVATPPPQGWSPAATGTQDTLRLLGGVLAMLTGACLLGFRPRRRVAACTGAQP